TRIDGRTISLLKAGAEWSRATIVPVESALNPFRNGTLRWICCHPRRTALSQREDGRQAGIKDDPERLLDLMAQPRRESLGSMAFYCTCCGSCSSPAVCRCACNRPASGR